MQNWSGLALFSISYLQSIFSFSTLSLSRSASEIVRDTNSFQFVLIYLRLHGGQEESLEQTALAI